mgnify:CR=1 FL=1
MDLNLVHVNNKVYDLFVISNDRYITPTLANGFEWDGWMREDLRRWYKKGTDILDIGANIGSVGRCTGTTSRAIQTPASRCVRATRVVLSTTTGSDLNRWQSDLVAYSVLNEAAATQEDDEHDDSDLTVAGGSIQDKIDQALDPSCTSEAAIASLLAEADAARFSHQSVNALREKYARLKQPRLKQPPPTPHPPAQRPPRGSGSPR